MRVLWRNDARLEGIDQIVLLLRSLELNFSTSNRSFDQRNQKNSSMGKKRPFSDDVFEYDVGSVQ